MAEDAVVAAPEEEEEKPPGALMALYNSFDADEVFSYDTPKIMRLLDRRLGMINFIGRTIIWLYILGYALIANENYFSKAPGYGPLAVKLVNDSYAYAPAKGAAGSKLGFTAFDSVDAVTPFLETGALFVMTQIQKTQGQRQGTNGQWSPAPGAGVTLPLDVAKFKVRYMSFISFPSIDPEGKQRFSTPGFNSKLDVGSEGGNALLVKDLVSKAGLSFSSVKATGAVLQVHVLWNCFLLLPSCTPKIQVTALENKYHIWRVHHYATPTGRLRDLEKCTGIRMVWRSVGSGNQLDPIRIIFHIASGVAMLPLAAFVTDFFMFFVMPERNHYTDKIFEETPDYSLLDEIQERREAEEARRKEEQSAVDVEALFSANEEG